MADIGSIKSFSTSMALTLNESRNLLMTDVQYSVDRLEKKKASISDAGLERLQEANRTVQQMADQRRKVDVYV